MFEGPAVALIWLMSPAIIAFGSIGAAFGVHAISKLWEGDEDASKRA